MTRRALIVAQDVAVRAAMARGVRRRGVAARRQPAGGGCAWLGRRRRGGKPGTRAQLRLSPAGAGAARGRVGEPIATWRVTGPAAHVGGFGIRRGGGLTRFAGRAEEFATLQQRWGRRAGTGQVLLLTCEPDIGKSRLARELHKWARAEAHVPIRFSGSQHDTDSPLFPTID